jgi:hypothetical protein
MAGWALIAAWAALVRSENILVTLLGRFAAILAVVGSIFMLLPGAKARDLPMLGTMFLMFMALPVLVGAYVFAGLRFLVGTVIYLGLLGVASASFAAVFINYLHS